MSSIPSAKMKHAHAHEGEHPEQSQHPTHQPEAQGEQHPSNDGGAVANARSTDVTDSAPGAGPAEASNEGVAPASTGPASGQDDAAREETAGTQPDQSSEGGVSAADPIDDAGYAEPQPGAAAKLAQRAKGLGEEAVGAVKARPKAAIAVGAALVAGAAAIVAGPALAERLRGEDDEAAPKRKPAAKKKTTAKKS